MEEDISMKIIRRSVLVLAACICMAAILSPFALAAGQGQLGTGTMNQMQAHTAQGQAGANGGQMQAPPSGTMIRNQSDRIGTRDGTGFAGDGNRTMRQPPGSMDGNMTLFRGTEGNRTMTPLEPRDGLFANRTADTRNGDRPGDGLSINSTMVRHGPGSMDPGNTTLPADATAGGQAPAGGMMQPASQSAGQEQQQSKDDVIASLINQLQGLLSGKK
jgi:hypothetical protein